MSRLGRRRSLTLAATALAVLAAPSAAHAATYTVKAGEGPCGGGDPACGGLVEAAAAAAAGDVFNLVAPGTYTSATFNTDVTINGGAGAVIDGTVEFAGGAVSRLSKVAVVTGAGNAPAVYVSGGDGLELSDAIVISRDGFGVFITSGAGNKIVRSGIATGGQATGAVQVQTGPDDQDPVDVTVESTVLSGGGAGIRALTRNNEAEALAGRRAGDITLTLRHITAAGSTNGIDIDSSNSRTLLGGTGDIAATVTDSIAFNNRVVAFPGTLLPLLGANSATLARTRTLEAGDPGALFVNPASGNFHLREDASAARNQGGVTPGESTTDVDGQDRSAAPTDLGADEWYPAPPPTAPPAPGPGQNDGTAPAIAVTKPTANQKIKRTSRRTRTVTVNGKRVRRTTTRVFKRLAITGTAKDPSGVKGVIVTIQKLGTAPGAKCKWYNATKGLVLKSCTKPPLLLARLAADGTWTYNANRTRLSAGKYRIIVLGADNSGAAGNSAPPADSIRRFTVTNR